MDRSGIATTAAAVLADAAEQNPSLITEHSEDISVVASAEAIILCSNEHFADAATADVARRHLLQLQRFGRVEYPHRNAWDAQPLSPAADG